jgi:hypothetical protein
MRIKVGRKTWTICDADIKEWGLCSYTERLIEIRRGQRPKNRLNTVIHELLHAARQEFTEKEVYAIADAISEALWRDGWRRNAKP